MAFFNGELLKGTQTEEYVLYEQEKIEEHRGTAKEYFGIVEK